MMKFKFSKIAALFIAIALLSITALAVVSYTDWQDGTQAKTISKGETATFDVALFTSNAPLTYSVIMYNPAGDIAKTWFNDEVSTDGFVENLNLLVTPADITTGGEYTIIISSTDGNGDSGYSTLTLTVLNIAPVIDWIYAPASITAGEELYVAFDGYDADDDVLTYSIYRDDALVSNLNDYVWTTSASDLGAHTFRFEISDGEESASETRTVTVVSGPVIPPTDIIDAKETLVVARDIEISQVYGDLIKIRNTKGQMINNFEMIITYLGANAYDRYSFDLGKNDVVLEPMSANLPANRTSIAKVEIKANGMEDSGYLLINS